MSLVSRTVAIRAPRTSRNCVKTILFPPRSRLLTLFACTFVKIRSRACFESTLEFSFILTAFVATILCNRGEGTEGCGQQLLADNDCHSSNFHAWLNRYRKHLEIVVRDVLGIFAELGVACAGHLIAEVAVAVGAVSCVYPATSSKQCRLSPVSPAHAWIPAVSHRQLHHHAKSSYWVEALSYNLNSKVGCT